MPCTVKCRCGKSTMTFKKLNPGDIETYDCPACDAEMKETRKRRQKEAAPVPKVQNNPYGKPLKKREPIRDSAPSAQMVAAAIQESAE